MLIWHHVSKQMIIEHVRFGRDIIHIQVWKFEIWNQKFTYGHKYVMCESVGIRIAFGIQTKLKSKAT
jgi:hypothetical protein